MKDKQKKWDAASRAQRRVMVAEDVLAQVKLGEIKVTSGTYLSVNQEFAGGLCQDDALYDVINETRKCKACAIGSVFYSKITNYGYCSKDHKMSAMNRGSDGIEMFETNMVDIMADAFTEKELRTLEYAFEGYNYGGIEFSEDDGDILRKYHHKHASDKARLKAIMKNIIKNKGDFTP